MAEARRKKLRARKLKRRHQKRQNMKKRAQEILVLQQKKRAK